MTSNAVAAAREGKLVVVVAPRRDEVRDYYARMMDAHVDLVGRRTAGLIEIRTPEGGRIVFESNRSPGVLRGWSADVVLVTDPAMFIDPSFVPRARAATATATRAEIGLLIEG